MCACVCECKRFSSEKEHTSCKWRGGRWTEEVAATVDCTAGGLDAVAVERLTGWDMSSGSHSGETLETRSESQAKLHQRSTAYCSTNWLARATFLPEALGVAEAECCWRSRRGGRNMIYFGGSRRRKSDRDARNCSGRRVGTRADCDCAPAIGARGNGRVLGCSDGDHWELDFRGHGASAFHVGLAIDWDATRVRLRWLRPIHCEHFSMSKRRRGAPQYLYRMPNSQNSECVSRMKGMCQKACARVSRFELLCARFEWGPDGLSAYSAIQIIDCRRRCRGS